MSNETEITQRDFMSRKFILALMGMSGYLAHCFLYKLPIEPVGIATIIGAYGIANVYGKIKNGG